MKSRSTRAGIRSTDASVLVHDFAYIRQALAGATRVNVMTDTGDATRPGPRVEDALAELARSASIEVTPVRIGNGAALRGMVPAGTRVYVPYLANARYDDTLRACDTLRDWGMQPVPHLPARAVASAGELHCWLTALSASGVTELLLIAGDRRHVAGPYADTLQLLESGQLPEHGFRSLAIAGHPEGHPTATPAALENALLRKRDYATATGSRLTIVTQFAFSSAPLYAWLRDIRQLTGGLPVHVGVPGPAGLRTLIAYAAQCGVGASARVLRQRPDAARLLGRWTPDGMVRDLVQCQLAVGQTLFQGLHLFPFGGIEATAAWLQRLRRDCPAVAGGEPGVAPPAQGA